MPASDGPTMTVPAAVLWHAPQWATKTRCPAASSGGSVGVGGGASAPPQPASQTVTNSRVKKK